MWHEARKQERIIRGMIVDYRRRAERRRDFYEKIKADPTQFLQLHGRPCKIHLDPAVAAAGDSPAIMMPWQGDSNNLIDRFDVRAHLDYIPEIKIKETPHDELSQEERQCNYERYRILAQNNFLGLGEDKFLQQLAIEEKFGVTIEEREAHKEKSSERKGTGAAIGYNYNDPGSQPSCSTGPEIKSNVDQKESDDDDSDLEMIDVDLSIDVNKMDASQAHELNGVGPLFGMAGCDLFSFLTGDADDAEHHKQMLRDEKEKALYSGRKSRRERRAHRDKRLQTRVLSPPSYAAPSTEVPRKPSRSPSRSPSPRAVSEQIQFITSFGGDEEENRPVAPALKPLYADKVKQNLKRMDSLYSEVVRTKAKRSPLPEERSAYKMVFGPKRQKSRSPSFSRSRSRSFSRNRLRPRSRSYSRSRSNSRSHSRSYSPRYKSRSRSRSRSRTLKRRSRSPSHTNHASSYSRRNESRSLSIESEDKSNQSKVAIPRYYGRKKDEKQSSSEISYDSASSDDNDNQNKPGNGCKFNTNQSQLRSGSSTKGASRETLSLKEKLKRKMQVQLSKQLRADKRAEAERVERESRRQARRDEEMRELAIKLRRKQREMRHQQNYRSSEESDRSQSSLSSRASPEHTNQGEKSRSKSATPERKILPVWESNENRDTTIRSYRNERGETSQSQECRVRKYATSAVNEEEYSHRPSSYHTNKYNDNIREFDNKHADYQQRSNDFQYRRREPYGHRGGYKDNRIGHMTNQSHEGPSWGSTRESEYSGDHERKGNTSASSKKVKLVDY